MSQGRKHLFILLSITVIALMVRLYHLGLYPPSLNWDEVSHGYNAYSILKTTQDEWGHFLPTIFQAYGDFKLPVYIYLTVPFVKLFGLTAYGVRMVSVLAGVGSVIFTYLSVKELFYSTQSTSRNGQLTVPTVTALAMALSPWTVFLSRIAVEANLAAFFIIAGAYFFLLGVSQKAEVKGKAWGFAVSGLLFGLSLFTYNSARIFVPLLLGFLIWVYRKEILKQVQDDIGQVSCHCHLVGFTIFLFFFTGMTYQMLSIEGQVRFQNISVLDQGTINRINENRGASVLPEPLPRLIYNKGTSLIGRSAQNYISYFNPYFWFVKGGTHYQFSIPNYPLIYPIDSLLILIGLIGLFKMKGKGKWLIFGWLLLAPIPASPTRDNPHALRIITLMPVPFILLGLGVLQINAKLKVKSSKLIILILYLFVLGWSFNNFWQEYTTTYQKDYAWAWQDGNQQMVESVKKYYNQYDQIFVTKKYGEPHEFILFYWPWNPADYINKRNWDYHDKWYWVNGFDKFVFVNDWEIYQNVKCQTSTAKCLLVTSPMNVPDGWLKLETIYNLNQEAVFGIYESL